MCWLILFSVRWLYWIVMTRYCFPGQTVFRALLTINYRLCQFTRKIPDNFCFHFLIWSSVERMTITKAILFYAMHQINDNCTFFGIERVLQPCQNAIFQSKKENIQTIMNASFVLKLILLHSILHTLVATDLKGSALIKWFLSEVDDQIK